LSISPNTNVLFSLKPVAVSANIYDGSGTGSAMPFFKDLSFTTNDNSIQTQSLVSSMLPIKIIVLQLQEQQNEL
jgi:hypothetical protein